MNKRTLKHTTTEDARTGERRRQLPSIAIWALVALSLASGCNEQSDRIGAAFSLRAVGVSATENHDDAVEPTVETIAGGKYVPLSRPLFLYVNVESLRRPELQEFLRFYLGKGQHFVDEVGYVRLSEDLLEASITRLQLAIEDVESVARSDKVITIDGSSTVFPMTQAVAEEFMREHPNARIVVGTSGTGGGFRKFATGETDVNDASRAIQEGEAARCGVNGIRFFELAIAIDGLTIVINSENDWCDSMTVSELASLWGPNSRVRRWNQIRDDWPDEEIRLYGPDTDSGTFDYFTEKICGKGGASRADYTPSADDNVLVRGVVNDKYALGYFGFAYYQATQK